jgi:radical SAM/Cys-rich protein
MHDTLPLLLNSGFPEIHRGQLETIQVNLGYRCNQRCLHCHVNAGPNRREMMSRENVELLLTTLKNSSATTLDITGGAPEMHPDFMYLVEQATGAGVQVIDRCNLTILNEPGYEEMAGFLAQHRVEVVASMPCYLEQNVDAQRGDGVYDSSIIALKKLNALGYGDPDSGLQLNLVYNPAGPVLPPPQESLLEDYKKELLQRAGVVFNQLFCLANMPIKRFGSTLVSNGKFHEYMQLLKSSHQDKNLDTVMCRNLLSIDWEGYVYDCDFNQMLNLPLRFNGHPRMHLSQLLQEEIGNNRITVADHCYGCTAGNGSSCGGALDTATD